MHQCRCLGLRSQEPWCLLQGKGSLYIRPLLLGTGPILGLGPAPSYTFLVYVAAVGAYFKARSTACLWKFMDVGAWKSCSVMWQAGPEPVEHVDTDYVCAKVVHADGLIVCLRCMCVSL